METPAPEPMLLRVVEPDRVRKLKLSSRPASVDALIRILKEELQLDLDFSLQYEDPDFGGDRTDLVQIDELPQKAVVHLVLSNNDSYSLSSSLPSTDILSDVSTPERGQGWPTGPFPIPTFSFDVELVLSKANAEYEKTGALLTLRRDQKHDILEVLAKNMFSFKAYESQSQREQVAKALVTKHPCLKEAGSEGGWERWLLSITHKTGNYRTKLKKAGCLEVSVNAGKRSRDNPDNDAPHTSIKRPRHAELNFLPNFPQGQDEASLELLRTNIVEEFQKREKNLPLIRGMMQNTFALRRQGIVLAPNTPVIQILNRWPALKLQSEAGSVKTILFLCYALLFTQTVNSQSDLRAYKYNHEQLEVKLP